MQVCPHHLLSNLYDLQAYTQKRPSRKVDKDGGDGRHRISNSIGERGGNDSASKYTSRPRGTSDAAWGMIAEQLGVSSHSK